MDEYNLKPYNDEVTLHRDGITVNGNKIKMNRMSDHWTPEELKQFAGFWAKKMDDWLFHHLCGPKSITCDVAGDIDEEYCKTCLGTGGCRYGKTDEEYRALNDDS